MPSSGVWRRVDIVLTYVSEETRAMNQRKEVTLAHCSRISYTLKMEEIRSSETLVNKISTRRHNSSN
jgi:hypothetical protein